jgi:preprotein translocase subunit SecE
VARNRKRAKERRARQPVASGRVRETERVRETTSRALAPESENGGGEAESLRDPALELTEDGAPDPIAQAAPDAEVAQARIAQAAGVEVASERELEEEAEAAELELAPVERARPGAITAQPWLGARLVAFLEGSWRELQRVQWPDRRQVIQATSVVIGFVIVAAVFLGVADLVANKVVNFVIYGR